MSDSYRVERWTALYTPNNAMLRYSLEGEGFECFQWVDRPGVYYGLHKHPEAQSHWIVSGKIEIHARERSLPGRVRKTDDLDDPRQGLFR